MHFLILGIIFIKNWLDRNYVRRPISLGEIAQIYLTFLNNHCLTNINAINILLLISVTICLVDIFPKQSSS